jgi:hypothetical protein
VVFSKQMVPVIERVLAERCQHGHPDVDIEPEHLLVGLALVGDALDDSFLRDAGATANRVRAELSRQMT